MAMAKKKIRKFSKTKNLLRFVFVPSKARNRKRIKKRFDQMLQDGAIEEVKILKK